MRHKLNDFSKDSLFKDHFLLEIHFHQPTERSLLLLRFRPVGWGEGGAAIIQKTTSCIADGLGNNGDISVTCTHYSGQYPFKFCLKETKEYGDSIEMYSN